MGFSYQFTGFKHGYVKLYTADDTYDKEYTKVVGTYYPVDNEVHNLSLNLLPAVNKIKVKYFADDGYYWKAGSKVYFGGGESYIDAWSENITNDSTSSPKASALQANSASYMPLKFTAQSSPVPKAVSSYSCTQNLTHCTSDYSDTTITVGEHTITLTANSGYFFT